MKKIVALVFLFLSLHLSGDDLVVFDNEYNIVPLEKNVKKIVVGNKEMINVSLLRGNSDTNKYLKIFGKQTGTTSILLVYRDGSMQNYHVYVNKNLGYIQKMINVVEPSLRLNKVGDGSTVISGMFSDPHNKNRVYQLLENAGVDLNKTMDLTETHKVNKMIRTKLYLVEVNNQKARDLGGVTGLGFVGKNVNALANPLATNAATFSGWLLDNAGLLTTRSGTSVASTLSFLEEKGVGKILDDTVLITTEDKNASFRVGGEAYIPVGVTQNLGLAPTIQVEEREYGLTLTLNTKFMEKENFMYIDVDIEDSAFDSNPEHNIKLGTDIEIPSFISKNINTNVVVRSGQVIALGGRLHSEDVELEEKVPFLGDIPLLGELFKHTVKKKNGNDLLFFLVPEIVDANEDIDDGRFYRDNLKQDERQYKRILDMSVDEVKKEQELAQEDAEPQIVIDEESNTTSDEIEVEEPMQESMEQNTTVKNTLVQEEIEKPTYAVAIESINIRDLPSLEYSKMVTVWKQGHRFIAGETKSAEGVDWLKIEEDCFESCIKLDQALWISKKYTNKL